MNKVFNFSTGPAMLPEEVVKRATQEISNYKGKGVSIMEIDSSSADYDEIITKAESSLRRLLNVPPNYKILFMQGGAFAQYSAVPMNLFSERKSADYVISGKYSKTASIEAKKYGDIFIARSSAGATPAYSTIPNVTSSDLRPDADYVHICYNNTFYGTKYNEIPEVGTIPLVADMSSFLLSEPIDVSKFALIYADGECNVGAPGISVVIIRETLLRGARKDTPLILNYDAVSREATVANSLPLYSIYIASLVFDWIESIGGLEEMKRRNERKASKIYDYLDNQFYYTAPVDKKYRSLMNIVFVTGDAALDKKFAKEAEAEGLLNLRAHGSVGGLSASMYNSMPYEGVDRLIEFMKKFAQENPKLDS